MKQINTKQITTYLPTFNQGGFTLVEMMVVTVILGVVVSMAVPNMSRQLADNRIREAERTIVNAHKDAQAEAMIQHRAVTVTYHPNSTGSSSIELGATGRPFHKTYQLPTDVKIYHKAGGLLTSDKIYSVRPSGRTSSNMSYCISTDGLKSKVKTHVKYTENLIGRDTSSEGDDSKCNK